MLDWNFLHFSPHPCLVLVHKESNQFFDATTKPVAVVFFGVGVFSNFCFIFFGQITLMVSIAMLSDWPSRTCQVQIRLEPLKESWIMQTSFVLKFVWKMFFQYWNMFFCFFASQGFLDLSIYILIFSHV